MKLDNPITVTVEVPGNEPFRTQLVYGGRVKLNQRVLHRHVLEALREALIAAELYGERVEAATAAPGETR